MKKAFPIILIALLVIGAISAVSTYNRMVTAQEKVSNEYANIETQLQRRADLIPNLVSTVKGYMAHEQGIIDSITAAREKLMNANGIKELAAANDELSATLQNLNVVVENYPDLKASQNFISLQDELAGTENRLATARRDYNTAVNTYNTLLKRFPGNILAGMFGFDAAGYFEASEGSAAVPDVTF